MPLESGQGFGGDISKSRMCGVEIGFKSSITDAIRFNIEHGPFDLILAPLMYPGYVPKEDNDPNCQILDQRLLPYAGSDFHVSCGQWSGLVVGKITPWLDLDSENEITRMEAETILRKQIEWASYLSIKACVLPTPKGNSCANYARCVNQILQSKNNMQLLVRFPFGTSDDDYSPGSNALVDSSWQTWNSFRLLCDYHNQLLIVLHIMRVLPPENSQKRWYGEPVTAAILDSDMFLTKARGNTVYLPKRHQKLIGDFLGHDIQIIISGLKVLGEAQFTAEGSKPHPLLPYRDQVSNIYKQIVPPSEQQRPEFGPRDFLQLPLLPLRNYTNAQSYQTWELDQVKYINYEIAICKALRDRVSDEKASEIATVLVVVGAARGALVRSSLQAAQRAGRKLKVYAVEKNPQAAIALDELIRTNNWSSFVIIVSSDVRNWNAPERADILISPTYRPSLVQQFGSFSLEASWPFAKSDLDSVPYQWNIHAADEMLRKDSETAFKQELALASYLTLQACILPTPKGDTWTNYARCANQFLQEYPNLQLWLRIPLGKPDDDSKTLQTPVSKNANCQDGYWKMWNLFRLLSDHNSELFVTLDNLSTMPSDNSLNQWYGEPVAAFIIHTDVRTSSDLFKDSSNKYGDNPKHLSEGIQKLITYFLNHYSQIIISENQLGCSKDEEYHLDTDSAADSWIHRLLPDIDHARSIYQQMDPHMLQERSQVAFRDVLLPIYKTTRSKNYFSSKKRSTPLSGQEIIVSYQNRNNNNHDAYLTIIPFPSNLRIDGPGGNDFSIGEAYLSDLVNGFVLIAGDTFYCVANPVTQILSNTYENPTIVRDAFVRYFLGYDGVRHDYKLVRFENAQDERTLVDCFIIGTDVDWRRVVTSDLITIVDDEWLTNNGVHTHFTNHSSRLHIICNERLENGMLRECIFAFDCQSEQEVRIVLPQEVGNPILCVLANKLCCAFFVANRLTIHQLLETTIWTILIDVVVNPPIPQAHNCIYNNMFHMLSYKSLALKITCIFYCKQHHNLQYYIQL